MKKLLFIILGIILIGCEPKKVEEEKVPTENVEVFETDFYGLNLKVEEFDKETYLHQGDILIPKNTPDVIIGDSIKAAARTSSLWDGKVYYKLSSNMESRRDDIETAITMIEEVEEVDLEFVEGRGEGDYIYFISGTGCYSYIGKIGGRQQIGISDYCTTGNILHEILHALGYWHEQSRIDRDEYITIHWDNIRESAFHNFEDYESMGYQGEELTDKLDFNSIMMYHPLSFSKNGHPTITKKGGGLYVAQRDGLSEGDIEGLQKIYPKDSEPEYENGKYYVINGVTVLRMYDTWYLDTQFGWRQLRLVDGVWYWA